MAGFQQSINQLLTTAGVGVGLYNQLPAIKEKHNLKDFDVNKLGPTREGLKQALGIPQDTNMTDDVLEQKYKEVKGTKYSDPNVNKLMTGVIGELDAVIQIYEQRGQKFPTVGYESREQVQKFTELRDRLQERYEGVQKKQQNPPKPKVKKQSGGNP